MKLRDYQLEGVDQLRKAFRTHRSALYQLPTGGGKSPVAGYIAAALAKRGRKALILVHRRELVRQFAGTLKDVGLEDEFGIIAAGFAETPWARFQLATVQTLYRRDFSFDPRIVIVDEAHHMKAKTWETVIARYPNAKLIGLTATAGRLDGKPLGDHFQVLIQGPSIKELVAGGWIAPMRTLHVDQGLSVRGVRTLAGDYSKREMGERVTERTVVAAAWAYQRYTPGAQAIFFGINTHHSKNVAEKLRDCGVRAEHLESKTPMARRDRMMDEFKAGHVKVLCNCDLFSEGVDVPACEVILAGRPTKSVTLMLQQAGRASRPGPNKIATFIDLAQNVWRLGFPDEDRTWSLNGIKQGTPKNTGAPGRRIRCCGGCSHMYPARLPACPYCGQRHVLPLPREVEMELTDVKRSRLRKSRHKNRDVRMRIHKILVEGRGFKGIQELGRQLHYSPMWADRMAEYLKIKRNT